MASDKILLVISSLGPGGAEHILCEMANWWARSGRSVKVFTFEDSAVQPFYELYPEIDHRGLGLVRTSPSLLMALLNNVYRIVRLRRALKESAGRVTISFGTETNCLVLLASVTLGRRAIVAERCDPRWYPREFRWRVLRRLLYPLAHAVVVQTTAAAEYFQGSNRVRVIPNPALPIDQTISDVSDAPAIPATPFIAGMGRLTDQKNFEMLIEAFCRGAEKYPDWSVVIFGEGPNRSKLNTLVRRLALEHRIYLPGVAQLPWRALRRASFFVLPSRYEGFPNVLCEAMACGLPVIATDCPSGPREIVRDGVDGVLVSPENVQALASAMDQLMSDEKRRHELGTAAKDVTQRFSMDRVMGMWNLLLETMGEQLRNPTG